MPRESGYHAGVPWTSHHSLASMPQADLDHAARAWHDLRAHNDDNARRNDGLLRPSLCMAGRSLTREQPLCNTFLSSTEERRACEGEDGCPCDPSCMVWGLLLGAMMLSMACGEGVLRLCPASVLPADLPQGLRATSHDVGLSHPTIGVLEHPFRTGVFTGSDVQAVYHTDGHGFRNPSPWPPEVDLVVLGDAVAFGYGVEDAQVWPALLAQWLAPQRVLNLGLIRCWSPAISARV